jgi:hypothetical protein
MLRLGHAAVLRQAAGEGRVIPFEIGMLGHYGLYINDPQEMHVLRSLPGDIITLVDSMKPPMIYLERYSSSYANSKLGCFDTSRRF